MNRDDIIRMAREAGFEVMDEDKYVNAHITDTLVHIDTAVERFAALIAAAEREACAKVLDEMAAKDKLTNYYTVAALAIRERGAP